MKKLLLAFVTWGAMSLPGIAEDFWVTQYRAAPGNFPALLDLVKSTDWSEMGEQKPIMMRHSQGNHWDLMLLGQHGSCANKATCNRAMTVFSSATSELVDFEVSFLATSISTWAELTELNTESGLYHIEMFQAAAGKHSALDRQRRIENDYIEKIGQRANAVFTVKYGTDVDIFTVGFYRDMTHFAESPDLTSEQFEAAAVEAGFKNRADISFHLRELIVGHQDTLAVKVK
ncbi:MAG: hypothetical protein AB3N28_14495 [Kordiimonas sp.]